MPDEASSILAYITDNYLHSYEKVTSLFLTTQVIYNIYIRKSVSKKLSEPYNPCHSIFDTSYRHSNCINNYSHVKVAEKYKCSFPGHYNQSQFYEKSCDHINNKTLEFKSICSKKCPKECDSLAYDLTVTSNAIKGNDSGTKINFGAFFSDLSYIEITQVFFEF